MDIAQLGIEVQSGGVKSATNDLKQFTNASRVAERAASGLSDASGKFSTSEIAAMSAAMGGVEKTSNAAAKAMAAAALAAQRAGSVGANGVKSLGQASGAARQQVQNLSYQMQDIVTMMAMGQSPFMLLAQQLPQVTQNGGQLNGVLSAMKQTIAGLISPLGLATTAFVFLGSAAISYFTEWMSKGSSANELLKEQAQLIQTVADRWGDAIPALREYADQLTRAREAAELREGLSLLNDNTLESVRGRLSDVTLGFADLVSNLSAAGEEATVIRELQEAFARFAESAADGSLQVSEVERVQNALSAAVNSTGIPAIDSFRAFFDTLSSSALNAAESVGAATQAANIAQSRINDPRTWRGVGLESNVDGRIQGEMFPLPEDGPTPGSRPLIELEGMPKVRGSGGTKQKAYESATASINEQTRALQAQTAAQQSLNPAMNDYGYAVAKAKVETDLLLAAEKDKKSITPELTAQIGAQAEKYAQAAVEQNKLTEATKRANETMSFIKNTTAGFINDLRDGLKNGEGFWASFGNAALSVLDRITDRLLNQVLDAVFQVSNAGSSSGGGGFLSSLFGGLFGGGKGAFPSAPGGSMYATGTASARAGMAMVGERGPEIVRFGGGEQVVPNHRLGTAFSRGGSANNNTTNDNRKYTIDARGSGPGVEDQIVAAIKAYDKQAQKAAVQRTAASMKQVATRGMYK
ncbi:phage tail length tape measure family protein [Rhizobium sp. Leaf311]|uniref:phage tail length tape measure family protein n=1 Tax=Rhizobium sp. Leaf311 TaxID=1736332 RepID=UPI0007890190|nr:phage tail length tape measure family protein [Rhizobium sp. Leaf311]